MDHNEPGPGHETAGADLVLPVLAGCFAVYYLITTAHAPMEARINGLFVASVPMALIALLIARVALARRRGAVALSFPGRLAPRREVARRMGFIGLTALAIAAMPWLGFTPTMFLFLASSMRLLGVRSPPMLVAIPLLAAAAGYLLFIAGLGLDLGAGPLERLLETLG